MYTIIVYKVTLADDDPIIYCLPEISLVSWLACATCAYTCQQTRDIFHYRVYNTYIFSASSVVTGGYYYYTDRKLQILFPYTTGSCKMMFFFNKITRTNQSGEYNI